MYFETDGVFVLSETMNLGNYLEFPSLGRAPRLHDFSYSLENVQNHLAC